MYANINRGACLLRLQRYLIFNDLVLSHGLVLHIGLTSLRCIASVQSFSNQKKCQLFLLIFVLLAETMG